MCRSRFRAPDTPAISVTKFGCRQQDAVKVWDTLIDQGKPFDIKPTGMLALDVARIEAGLLLIDVDFNSSKKALIEAQKYSPFEMGLGRLVNLDKPKVCRSGGVDRRTETRDAKAHRRLGNRLA